MAIVSLELTNFRNHKDAHFEFSPQTTVIVGPNGSGKTNILEAIYILATTRSPRAHHDSELISFGESTASIFAKTTDSELSYAISLPPAGGSLLKKSLKLNSVPKTISTFAGQVRAVLFRPEDIDILTDGPSLRRRWLDDILIQTSKAYATAHTNYHKVVSRRNKILSDREKSRTSKESELIFWDSELLKHGGLLQSSRQQFIDWLNITPTPPTLPITPTLNYLPNMLTLDRLASHHEAELAAGLSLIGPQRDDFEILEDNRNLQLFGSRGEQRTAVLALKLAELKYLKCKDPAVAGPVLLLDDIFSELDEAHQQAVMEVIGNQQTLFTTTEVPNFMPFESLQTLRLPQD